MIYKLLIISITAILWFLGGWDKTKWSGYRDMLVPILLGFTVMFFLPATLLWKIIIGIATCGTLNIIRMGYGNYDPEHDDKPSFLASITHDRGGWWIRGIYGAITSSIGALPLIIYNRHIYLYIMYIIINIITDFSVSRFKLKVLPCDLIVGSVKALVIFLI